MNIAVLGAGVIGLTTAWALVQKGHNVTIVDRQPAAGLETSFGNGGQLSYAYVAPLASTSTLAKLPFLLLTRAGPLRIRPSLDLDFIRWGLGFVRACNDDAELATTLALLELAKLSRREVGQITHQLKLSYGLAEPGKLVVFRSEESFAAATRNATLFAAFGVVQEITSPQRSLEIEPALRIPANELKGGVFTPTEQVGNCAEFCAALAGHLARSEAVTWRLNTLLGKVRTEGGRLKFIQATGGDIEADAFVLALGCGSTAFARSAGFYLPVQPLKGYSITASAAPRSPALTRSVTDFDNKTVFAPLTVDGEPRIRIAGIADMVGNNTQIDQKRLRSVRELGRAALRLDNTADDRPWAGLRPATPNGRPIIGHSPFANLFLNTGHGGLGWTLASGSARLCAELISGEATALPMSHFALTRL